MFSYQLAKNEINIQIQKSENEHNANKTVRINMVKYISEIRKHTKKVEIRTVVWLQDGCSVWIVHPCDCGAVRQLFSPCPASQEVGEGV